MNYGETWITACSYEFDTLTTRPLALTCLVLIFSIYAFLLVSGGLYAQKQLLLSACLSHRNSVSLSVRSSVRSFVYHMGGSVKNGAG